MEIGEMGGGFGGRGLRKELEEERGKRADKRWNRLERGRERENEYKRLKFRK